MPDKTSILARHSSRYHHPKRPMPPPPMRSLGTTVSPTSCLAFSFPCPFLSRDLTTLPQRSPLVPIRPPSHRSLRCLAQGFGNASSQRKSNPSTAIWAQKYKAYVKRNGELLCAMAWEGYEMLGRGAVFANYDDSVSGSMAIIDRGGANLKSATPSFYVDRDKLVNRNDKEQLPQMAPILRRIATYDPQKQFVVVFEADGTQGADIVTPNQPPSQVWARTRKDGGKIFDWEKND